MTANAQEIPDDDTFLAGEGDHVIVDGTPISIDRVRADEPYHPVKHRRHGMNGQVIGRPDGTPLWFSRATPAAPTT